VVVATIIGLVVQAINRPVDGETATYRAEFGDVFGLQPNADVRVRGVAVGKVTDIELTGRNIATVEFTLETDHPLHQADLIAIKFANLTGQRYLALEESAEPAPEVAADEVFTNTVDSFDITTVFNGLRPLLSEADPEVYNQLSRNLVALIEGSESDINPVLRDIATLSRFASDRTQVLTLIFDNLTAVSQQMRGRSENLENILAVFHSTAMPIATRMTEFLSLIEKGSVEMTEIVRTAEALSRLFLGAANASDDLTRRIDEAIPDTREQVRSLSLLPGLLAGLNRLIPSTEPANGCRHGAVVIPLEAQMLLNGRELTVCNGGG
jgi:phospholipid/cholesterol/gamma-HCH transport system substrate-binding protein